MGWFKRLLRKIFGRKKDKAPEVEYEKPSFELPELETIKPSKKIKDWIFDFKNEYGFKDLRKYKWVFLDPSDWRIRKGNYLVQALKQSGTTVFGYISVGSSETYRDDYHLLKAYRAKRMKGYRKECWLDITKYQVFDVMKLRMKEIKELGFDGFYCDNSDVHNHVPNKVSRLANVAYMRDISRYAKRLHLKVGINNGLEMLPTVGPDFDFFVNEQSIQYKEWHWYNDIVEAKKPIFHFEFSTKFAQPLMGHMIHVHKWETLSNRALYKVYNEHLES